MFAHVCTRQRTSQKAGRAGGLMEEEGRKEAGGDPMGRQRVIRESLQAELERAEQAANMGLLFKRMKRAGLAGTQGSA